MTAVAHAPTPLASLEPTCPVCRRDAAGVEPCLCGARWHPQCRGAAGCCPFSDLTRRDAAQELLNWVPFVIGAGLQAYALLCLVTS